MLLTRLRCYGDVDLATINKEYTHTHRIITNARCCCVYSTFLRNEHPSVRRALPPVGWHKTVEHEAQNTTVAA
jgi:hypothetical protein